MISVVILDYYSFERTIKYIEDFMRIIDFNNEMSFIIVDNTPEKNNFNQLRDTFEERFKICGKVPDYSSEAIEEIVEYKLGSWKVILAFSFGNPGFARGCNIGAQIAFDIFSADRILFSNNDIVLTDKDIITKLNLALDNNSDAMCTGPHVVGNDGLCQSPHRKIGIWGKWIIPFGLWPFVVMAAKLKPEFMNSFTDIIEKRESGKVYRVIGAFMLVDTAKFFEIGMFDDKTFLYGEEPILAERALKSGYCCYYVHDTGIIHEQNLCIDKDYNVKEKTRLRFNSEINIYYKDYLKIPGFVLFLAKIAFELFFFIKGKQGKNK